MEHPMKPQIRLVITRPDGHCSDIEIVGDPITAAMLEAAEELLHTTGERPPPPPPEPVMKRSDPKRQS